LGLSVVSLVLLGLTGVGWFVLTWEAVQLWRIRHRPLVEPAHWPSLSILKPLAGLDDELAENLKSHLELDYPGEWELLLGVRSQSDAAFSLAKAVAEANPGRVKLHLQEGEPGFNPKVNQLITLTRYAKGEVIALTDANIRVKPNTFREHACRLTEERVALTSNIFVGTGEESLGSALDNMTVNSFCAPSSATAELTLNMTQIVGKSLAVKRPVLAELGGWETVKDLLAEDQRFGRMLRKAGHRTRLCPTPVDNVTITQPFASFWRRHSRWAMMRFRLIPGTWFELLMNPTPWSLALALTSPAAPIAWGVFVATMLFSVGFTQLSTVLLRGSPLKLKWALMIPVRDFINVAVWFRGMTMRTVSWRGNELAVLEKTRLEPIKK
jgi:ceramide glucosyltransferase